MRSSALTVFAPVTASSPVEKGLAVVYVVIARVSRENTPRCDHCRKPLFREHLMGRSSLLKLLWVEKT